MVNEFIPPDYSGSGFVLYRYAHRLHLINKLGFILTLTESENKSNLDTDERYIPAHKIKRLKNLKFFYEGERKGILSRIPKFIFFNLSLSIKTFLLLFRNRKKFDIIRCFGSGWLSLYVIISSKILRKKIIIDLTSLGADDPSAITKNDKLKIIYILRKLQYKLSDKIICLSPALVKVCKKSKIPKNKIEQLSRSVNIKEFNPKNKINTEIIKKIKTDSRKIILYVGSFGFDKGADVLIKLFKQYYKKNKTSLKLVVLCENMKNDESKKYLKQLNDFCLDKNINNSTFFYENVSNVNEYMRVADLLVFPSKREGLPNVVLESMASGLPVIASKLPGIIDYIIDDGENGIIVENPLAENFLKNVEKLLDDQDYYKKISSNGREKIKQYFSNEIVDLKLDNLNNELMKNA